MNHENVKDFENRNILQSVKLKPNQVIDWKCAVLVNT